MMAYGNRSYKRWKAECDTRDRGAARPSAGVLGAAFGSLTGGARK
jgi:hypothetical protein